MYGDHYRETYIDIDNYFLFDFVYFDYGHEEPDWRAYIISDVDYHGRPDDGHSTHRLHESGETYSYVCWSSRIASLHDAMRIAKVWADCTSRYIRSNKVFDEILQGE